MRYMLIALVFLLLVMPISVAQDEEISTVDCVHDSETTPEPEATASPETRADEDDPCHDTLDITPGIWVLMYSQFAGCSMPSGIAGELSGFEIEIETNDTQDFVNAVLGNSESDDADAEDEFQQDMLIVDRSSARVLIVTQEINGMTLEMIFFVEDETRVTFSGVMDAVICSITVEGEANRAVHE